MAELSQPPLCIHFGPCVGSLRVKFVSLLSWRTRGIAVHAAAGCEYKPRNTGVLRLSRKIKASPVVHVLSHTLESIAHGIIRYRGQMHHAIHSLQQRFREIPHICEVLCIE